MKRQLISSGSPWELTVGYSRAVRVGKRLFVSGTAPMGRDGQCPEDAGEQMALCLDIVGMALADAGASYADVVRTRMYLVNASDFEAVGKVHGEIFGDIRPANTTVVVKELLDARWKVEIEVDAVVIGDHQPIR